MRVKSEVGAIREAVTGIGQKWYSRFIKSAYYYFLYVLCKVISSFGLIVTLSVFFGSLKK